MFSYIAKQQLDDLDLEMFDDGADAIHLRVKSTQVGFTLEEEKRLFMELHEKHYIEVRAQYQHDGFWGTGLRNDAAADGKMNRFNHSLPQGLEDYEWNKQHGEEPSVDIWPRMYTKEWLNK